MNEDIKKHVERTKLLLDFSKEIAFLIDGKIKKWSEGILFGEDAEEKFENAMNSALMSLCITWTTLYSWQSKKFDKEEMIEFATDMFSTSHDIVKTHVRKIKRCQEKI